MESSAVRMKKLQLFQCKRGTNLEGRTRSQGNHHCASAGAAAFPQTVELSKNWSTMGLRKSKHWCKVTDGKVRSIMCTVKCI